MPQHRALRHGLPKVVYMCAASTDEDKINVSHEAVRYSLRELHRMQRIKPHQPARPESDAENDCAGDEADVEGNEIGEGVDIVDKEMTRQRHVYETAFDCKINRSDDKLDDADRLTNHPVLHAQLPEASKLHCSSSTDGGQQAGSLFAQQQISKDPRRKVVFRRSNPIPNRLLPRSPDKTCVLQDIESLQINSDDKKTFSARMPVRRSTTSPASTGPLLAMFHGHKDLTLWNIRSSPNLPSEPDHPTLHDRKLPIKSLRVNNVLQTSGGSIVTNSTRNRSLVHENNDCQLRRADKKLIREFKDRPCEKQRPSNSVRENGPIAELKRRSSEAEGDLAILTTEPEFMEFTLLPTKRPVGHSSTESMMTSSSGDSMESLRSSTSEGNRSTSSWESRRSTSLSSHSSDSGSPYCFHRHQARTTLSSFLTYHASKLHILSPISDKSSQEPGSETSDNNRTVNSQKPSPDDTTEMGTAIANTTTTTDIVSLPDMSYKKRRISQNKNFMSFALQSISSGDAEIQGSDSGISIQSRARVRCKPIGFHLLQSETDNINLTDDGHNLSDVPFNMPKLRNKRLLLQQDATTSGSATSVDLRDLPFDMPKLRRRLRCSQSTESSTSRASSSLSITDVEPSALSGKGIFLLICSIMK